MAVTRITPRLAPFVQGRKNLLLNGNCNVGQRTTLLIAAGANTGYGLVDRWLGSSSTTQSLQMGGQTAALNAPVVAGASSSLEVGQNGTSTGTAAFFEQRIEGVAATAGLTLTLSFWAQNVSVGSITFAVGLVQNFGTGFGGSANVATATQNITVTTAVAFYSLTFTLGSLAGKTIGSDSVGFLPGWYSVRFTLPLTGSGSGVATQFWQLQLERGAAATAFDYRPFSVDLADCQRYYCTTYDPGNEQQSGTVSGTATTLGTLKASAIGVAANGATINWRFPVGMYRAPVTAVFSENGTANTMSVVGTPTTTVAAAVIGTNGRGGTTIANTGTVVAGTQYECHLTVTAELT